ncbi:glycosyltransferase family 90 protein [Venturia nashicola]|uniref:Glycosyltransferase family 90 protein n=1 Tax=Venturia nashicola TaxID=86259 RepID=A0A4Z1P4V9_9PEZI|nr:glycosyltransferase family 90 protein [Venturia nashicola]
MRPSLQQAQQNVLRFWPAFFPFLLILTSALSTVTTPARHSLFVNAVAWLVVALYYAFKVGVQLGKGSLYRRRLTWSSGVLYALAQICERASDDRDALWWSQSLLPAAIYLLVRIASDDSHTSNPPSDHLSTLTRTRATATIRLLSITTGISAVALGCAFVRFHIGVLGLCSVFFTAGALLLLEYSLHHDEEGRHSPPTTPNGLMFAPQLSEGASEEAMITMRDMAAVIAVVCLLASMSTENFKRYEWTYRPQSGPINSQNANLKLVMVLYNQWNSTDDLIGIILGAAKALFLTVMTRRQGALDVSLLTLLSTLISRAVFSHSLWNFWLTAVYTLATLIIFDDPQTFPIFPSSRRRMKAKQLMTLLAACSLLFFCYDASSSHRLFSHRRQFAPFAAEPPIDALGPLVQVDRSSHPIDQLIKSADAQFQDLLGSQSSTLAEAVGEYRRRYGLPPPPNFDIWYEYAKRKGVQLIDEYDAIHNQLLPFWAVEPSVIRSRVTEAIGYKNMLMTLLVRNGEVVKSEGGADWQVQATMGMMNETVRYLPDMDLPFNVHDEPRVIVPSDHLAHLVNIAKSKRMPAAFANKHPLNAFSARPKDMSDGKRIREVKTTRFNRFAHQHTWSHSRASCPPDSPARDFEEISRDNITAYAFGDLGFVYNHTAFSDICNSPSLRETYGFFDRPNAFNIVQDLFPIFSQSKISSFQDIIYPSPWYWAGKVDYDSHKDMPWEKKQNQMYWRGSTTGGFSRNGGWRRQHRQRVVRKMSAPDTTRILEDRGEGGEHKWLSKDVSRKDYKDIVDVNFSHVGQCDPGDCKAQKDFFSVGERVDQQDAWKYKFLLDMDGNAFSGRFYAFLKSHSLVHKMSIFQEWHMDWLKPWVHYVPITLRGDEWLESVRYFASEPSGKEQAPRLAKQGTEWANKALRNEDFEVWFFRLLLEYGRIIDDNREVIGYPGT